MNEFERKSHAYGRVAFLSMQACRVMWNENMEHAERAISRIFYGQVFSAGAIQSGFSTIPKNKQKGEKMSDDHCAKPQQLGTFIMDTEYLLDDYKEFFKVFQMCRLVHKTTSKQNRELREAERKCKVRVEQSYIKNGYKLYRGNSLIEEYPLIQVPNNFREWENKFQKNQNTSTCKPRKVLDDFGLEVSVYGELL